MTYRLPRTRKQRRRERRAADRLGLSVEGYRAYLEDKAARDNNAYRRRKRAAQQAAR